jgi:uncharacterized cupin superfamily protein
MLTKVKDATIPAAFADLKPAPIEPSWVRAGKPQARSADLAHSSDGAAKTLLWECTAGEFDWTYHGDETVHILEGEVIVDDGSGPRTLGPADVALFPAGSTWRWQVPRYVRKVAFLRSPTPLFMRLLMKAKRSLKGLVTRRDWTRAASLIFTVLAAAPAGA